MILRYLKKQLFKNKPDIEICISNYGCFKTSNIQHIPKLGECMEIPGLDLSFKNPYFEVTNITHRVETIPGHLNFIQNSKVNSITLHLVNIEQS